MKFTSSAVAMAATLASSTRAQGGGGTAAYQDLVGRWNVCDPATSSASRADCNYDIQSFNEILCECQMDYMKECLVDGTAPQPCENGMVPGHAAMGSPCTCVDPIELEQLYIDFAPEADLM